MDTEEIRAKIKKLKAELDPINVEIGVAEQNYASGLETLKNMGIEISNPNKVDLSEHIAELDAKIESESANAAARLEEANTLVETLRSDLAKSKST